MLFTRAKKETRRKEIKWSPESKGWRRSSAGGDPPNYTTKSKNHLAYLAHTLTVKYNRFPGHSRQGEVGVPPPELQQRHHWKQKQINETNDSAKINNYFSTGQINAIQSVLI